MSIKEMLEKKKKDKRVGRKVLLFLITTGGVFTALFPFFSIVFFAFVFSYLLMEFKHVIDWQTEKTYCKKCKEEHHIA